MGKPTGFMEYLREVAEEVAPSDRIRNWDEFHLPMPEENGCRPREPAAWTAAPPSATRG
jgi:hypothetical protein